MKNQIYKSTVVRALMLTFGLMPLQAFSESLPRPISSTDASSSVQISLGALTERHVHRHGEISDISIAIERIDYLTKNGWQSIAANNKVHFNLESSENLKSTWTFNNAEGLSEIKFILNKQKNKIADHRGHECFINLSELTVKFKKSFHFQGGGKFKLNIFLDLLDSDFDDSENRNCEFKPKYKVYIEETDASCKKNNHHKPHDDDEDDFSNDSDREEESGHHHGRSHIHDSYHTDKNRHCQNHGSISVQNAPTPVVPTPVVPTPVVPTPVAPTPVDPTPVAPTPVVPTPVVPTPVDPTPVVPTPVDPTPVVPTPVVPTPVDPTPVVPTPVVPTPVDPTPVDPTPVAQMPVGPTINNFRVLEVFLTGATVAWTTDIASTTQVKITDMSSGVVSMTSLDSTLVTDHKVFIDGLQPGLTYQFESLSTANSITGTIVTLVFTKD